MGQIVEYIPGKFHGYSLSALQCHFVLLQNERIVVLHRRVSTLAIMRMRPVTDKPCLDKQC